MQTIRRNQTLTIDSIFHAAKNVRRYDLNSGFIGVDVNRDALYAVWERHSRAKLQKASATGVFTLTVHSNLWYTFTTV